jgi:hypothetical protein
VPVPLLLPTSPIVYVGLTLSPDLFICAKDLFVEAKPLTWLHTQHSGGEGFSLPEVGSAE